MVLAAAGCSDDEPETEATTTSERQSSDEGTATTSAEQSLAGYVLDADDLPRGFERSPDVDDTITSFCANEDAAAGLQASARELAAFRRTPEGASILQLVFRFEGDDAATFVEQAAAILDRCSSVPDASGLAFEYEPASDTVAAALTGTDAHTSRYGVSVGSGNLTIDIAVFRHGDVGQLVAVLGLELPREELDQLAATTFDAAVALAEAESA